MKAISVDNITRILKDAQRPAHKEAVNEVMDFLCRQQEEGFLLSGTFPVKEALFGLFEHRTGILRLEEF